LTIFLPQTPDNACPSHHVTSLVPGHPGIPALFISERQKAAAQERSIHPEFRDWGHTLLQHLRKKPLQAVQTQSGVLNTIEKT